MNKLETDLLKMLCSGLGQGNTNTNKLTEKILESNPDLEYNKAKIEIVETLRELNDSGEIRIMTLNWELGEEFLYLYENIID
ncbi:MAG: hypothetical protein O6702_07615 [Candidatus Dadabacteria bacterium]|nr:hypothetical protein [Candidatus Dadabacteria bacterium]MCZ6554730.1 hypothetical protein [Candidatus Dadabacteria bacterium]